MSNRTVVNPNINATVVNPAVNATVVNPSVNATAVNPELAGQPAGKLSPGTLLDGKYEIVRPLSTQTGEADLYICQYEQKEYVAKVYRRKHAVKPEVLSKLCSIDSPYVASLYAAGEHGGLPYVVLPYYKNGSLQGRRFSLEELKKAIIPCINEALHVLHRNGIIHKDLKPSNLMLRDDGKSIAIIDFGISSVVGEGSTVLVTQTGMTPVYSAPEALKSVFLDLSDYYSFGITLYELYCGYTPYQNMSAEEITRFTAVQRVPIPEDMPRELQDLIFGLTYHDITNRTEPDNPNKRWTYAEVCNWCSGKKQVLPGEGVAGRDTPVYRFMETDYSDVPSLTAALAQNWEKGKQQLFRGLLSGFFKNFNPEIAGYCMDAEDELKQANANDDMIFWKLLYRICPELTSFHWLRQTYASLADLGGNMLERLWANDNSQYTYWDSILKNRLITRYLAVLQNSDRTFDEAAEALETMHNSLPDRHAREQLLEYYTMAYLLSGQKVLRFGGRQFKSIAELTAYMKKLLDSSYEEFAAFCHSLIDYQDHLNEQFEAWLIALGKGSELAAWRQQIAQ